MYLKFRILFTILSAICLAVAIPATALFGWQYLGIFGGGAILFFFAMLLCKQSHEKQEKKNNPDEPDFLNTEKKDKTE